MSDITQIKKRDGRIVDFDKTKIADAIFKAARAVGGEDYELAKKLSDKVVERVEKVIAPRVIPTVEEVQDAVEKTLIEEGHAKTAKAYILYRDQRTRIREFKSLVQDMGVIEGYISEEDWRVKENSNMTFSLQGLDYHISSKLISNYWLEKIYPPEVRNAHNNGDFHIHDLGTLGAYCFDEKTKILTENGWKLFKDVKDGEKVATKNLETGELEFQVPYAKQIYQYSGDMYSFEGRSVSLLVTPEHRLLVRRKGKKNWEFVNPPEFSYGMEFDKRLSWKGNNDLLFKVPEIPGGNRKKILDAFKIDDYVEFMGWYISEGSAYEASKGDYRVSIAQLVKKTRNEILALLKRMNLKANNQSEFNIHLHSKDLFYYLKPLGTCSKKYIPDNIKQLNSGLIKKFLIALFKGDGSLTRNGDLRRYYTRSKQLAEDVSECLLKIGLCGTISQRKDNKMYVVNVESNHLTPIYRNKVMKKKYNGKVYDFSVKNGTLAVMRDGKIVISGNCVGWDLFDLLMNGFKGVSGKIETKPPKHLRSALGQVVNFFYTLQGESAGAQAMSNFDTLLAPFIRYDGLDYAGVKQAVQEFVFNMNVPTRVGFQCMSEDTEILTPNGWKEHDELKEGDVIKTFNIERGVIENKPIKRLFKRHYKGIMYNLKNRIQNQLISPGHRVVRKKFQANNYVLEEIESIEKLKSAFISPVAGKNVADDIDLSDDEIRLLAWIIAEGCIENYTSHRHSKRITIYQSKIKNPENYNEITSLLKKFKLSYGERDSSPALGGPVKMIRLNADSSRKIHALFGTNKNVGFIPSKLLNMSERQSKLFLDTYLKASGFESCKIATTKKEILDGLQQIAVNAGYGFTVLVRDPTIGKKLVYVMRLIMHKDTYIQTIKKIKYDGIIWCPNTDNETVIARRDGKVFITGNTPFSNITLDIVVPDFMKNDPVIIGGKPMKETYGEFQEEMKIFDRAFAEVMMEGDAKGRPFTFPIPTICITRDFDWSNTENAIWGMTAKYGIPYFSNFVNSDMKPEDVRSMCCRLRIDNRELRKRGGGLFGAHPLTGSIGVVTTNMPRIGFNSKTEEEFFRHLDHMMILAMESLEIKRKALEKFTELGLYPYSRFYLRKVKEAEGLYWKNHFSTIGLVGMNEALVNFMGKNIASPEGREFALKVLDFMRKRLQDFQQETGHIYNLEATPAEGTSYRLAMIDKRTYPSIIVANEEQWKTGAAPFYTNSTQLPVNYTDDIFEALEIQDDIQTKYTGGVVFHGFLGERMPSIEATKKFVKKVAETFHLPYFTLTPTFSICQNHGYLIGRQDICPTCAADGKKVECEVYSRIVGYIRPVKQWNDGKRAEFQIRKTFNHSLREGK